MQSKVRGKNTFLLALSITVSSKNALPLHSSRRAPSFNDASDLAIGLDGASRHCQVLKILYCTSSASAALPGRDMLLLLSKQKVQHYCAESTAFILSIIVTFFYQPSTSRRGIFSFPAWYDCRLNVLLLRKMRLRVTMMDGGGLRKQISKDRSALETDTS